MMQCRFVAAKYNMIHGIRRQTLVAAHCGDIIFILHNVEKASETLGRFLGLPTQGFLRIRVKVDPAEAVIGIFAAGIDLNQRVTSFARYGQV